MNKLPGIKGPGQTGQDDSAVELDIPSCVKLVTKQDQDEFAAFVTTIINRANTNALDQLAEFVAQQNAAMTQLVRKLGG